MSFPAGFVWRLAAASYQIEGGAHDDWRGLSVWDMFCRKEGAIFSGHTGDIACDHYHRWRDDVKLMKEMGLQAYRLSIAWPRVCRRVWGASMKRGWHFTISSSTPCSMPASRRMSPYFIGTIRTNCIAAAAG